MEVVLARSIKILRRSLSFHETRTAGCGTVGPEREPNTTGTTWKWRLDQVILFQWRRRGGWLGGDAGRGREGDGARASPPGYAESGYV